MKKKFGLFPLLCLVLLLTLFLKPVPVAACSCVMKPSVDKGYSRSQAVFSGEVIGIKDNNGLLGRRGKTVQFNVKETWKGINETEVAIATGSSDGDCGIAFVVGEEYLVYARLSDMYGDESLTSIICDPTTELGNAAEDIAILGHGQVPTQDVKSVDNGKSTVLIGGGVVFIAGLLAVFGWYRVKRNK
ncbi:hypothetical protein ACOKXV_06575 [Sporosarcina psychrophila]|uniref:hypothetical protein n=1 Tax=Sporosarcina psychrophila TaxID=1476 RepID=UPI003B9E5E17